jgi:hypothetical protein
VRGLSSAAQSSLSPSVRAWAAPAAEVVTVGLPFCAFKLLTGLMALGTPLAPLGVGLIVLGAIDLALNATNLLVLLVAHRRAGAVCLADVALTRRGGNPELALALDMFLSFALVAVVVGFGLLGRLPAWGLATWNAAVVLNVLGAGAGRVLGALRPASPV